MIKTFTFGKINNNKNNTFCFNNNSTNYSKILDNIIIADITKKNDFLFKNKKSYTIDDILLGATHKYDSSDLDKAIKFLTNYKTLKKSYTLPYKLNKMYTLSDGTPIIFYDDEIQIGFDVYKYDDFSDYSFLDSLNKKTKDIIINIYTTGSANININLL